jgi:hypothetical protein
MDCPLCGTVLSEEQPHYYITLSDGESTADERDVRVCEECWERYRTALF